MSECDAVGVFLIDGTYVRMIDADKMELIEE